VDVDAGPNVSSGPVTVIFQILKHHTNYYSVCGLLTFNFLLNFNSYMTLPFKCELFKVKFNNYYLYLKKRYI